MFFYLIRFEIVIESLKNLFCVIFYFCSVHLVCKLNVLPCHHWSMESRSTKRFIVLKTIHEVCHQPGDISSLLRKHLERFVWTTNDSCPLIAWGGQPQLGNEETRGQGVHMHRVTALVQDTKQNICFTTSYTWNSQVLELLVLRVVSFDLFHSFREVY